MIKRKKITINDKRKIYAIQQEFSVMFPYLKIEFLAKSKKSGSASSVKLMKHPAKTLGECRTVHHTGTITVTPTMTVVDLEQNFRNVYGLSTIVLRKCGEIWLETTITDRWTLEEQNKQGEALSK